MERKKDLITAMILKSIVLIAVIVGISYMLKPASNGIVIDRTASKELIYGDFNLSMIKSFTVISLVLVSLVLGAYIINSVISLVTDKEETLWNNIYPIIEFALLGLVLVFSIYALTIYPLSQDKRNSYAFGFSLANIILILVLIATTIYQKWVKSSVTTKSITINVVAEGSILAALAVVLSLVSSLIPGLQLPQGGSFSLSMLPLFIFALRRGFKPGLAIGFVYGLLNFLLDGMIIHWGSIFFDYLIPYTLLGGVSGIFSKQAQKGNVAAAALAVLLGGFVRYVSHGFSGVLFFGEYAGGKNVWLYSFILYNLPYMLVSTIGSLIFTLLLQSRFITIETRIH